MDEPEIDLRRREFARRTALGVGGLFSLRLAEQWDASPRSVSEEAGAAATGRPYLPRSVTVEGDDTDRTSRARAVQNAIQTALSQGYRYVIVPSNFGPGVDGYDVSLVNFDPRVQMLREGNLTDTYDVKAYGAAGDYDPESDAGTDDTDAINAAADQVRALAAAGRFVGTRGPENPHHEVGTALHFSQGLYLCEDSIWLGADAAGGENYDDAVKNVGADPGSVIVSRNDGGVAIDAAGVFNLRVDNLTVFGHPTETPRVGWLNARSGATASPTPASSGGHRFQNVRILGHYSVAALYNYASEVNRWVNSEFRNAHTPGEATIYLSRDNGRARITSDHTTLATQRGYSNYAPAFVNCDIRGALDHDDGSKGLVIVESGTWGPKFYTCYFDLLQGAESSAPVIRERAAVTESRSSRRSQGISLYGCVVENDYDAILRIGGSCRSVSIRDCNFGGPGADTAEIVVERGGELRNSDIQRLRGDSHLTPMTFEVRGLHERSENRGRVTVPNGATSVTVEHGMNGRRMELSDITVTPLGDLGEATQFWISDLDDARFRICVDRDPGRTGASFVWRARMS